MGGSAVVSFVGATSSEMGSGVTALGFNSNGDVAAGMSLRAPIHEDPATWFGSTGIGHTGPTSTPGMSAMVFLLALACRREREVVEARVSAVSPRHPDPCVTLVRETTWRVCNRERGLISATVQADQSAVQKFARIAERSAKAWEVNQATETMMRVKTACGGQDLRLHFVERDMLDAVVHTDPSMFSPPTTSSLISFNGSRPIPKMSDLYRIGSTLTPAPLTFASDAVIPLSPPAAPTTRSSPA